MSRAVHNFDQLVVGITGASTGLGLATARAFRAAGARVAICARNPERLAALTQERDDHWLVVPADVTNRSDVDRFVNAIVSRFGRLDVFINNAGSGLIARVEQVPLAAARALFDTNFFGALHCLQAVLPVMQRQGTGQIILVSSIAGLHGIPNSGVYSASKAALVALGDALRIECRGSGIRVTTLCPGRLNDTAFFEHAKHYGELKLYEAPESLGTAAVVAAVLEAVRRPRRLIVLPWQARLIYWLSRFAPRLLDRQLLARMPDLRVAARPVSK